MHNKYPEFVIPEGLDLSGLEDGEEKEMLAVVRKTDDGRACIVAVEGVALKERGDDDEEEVEVEEESFPDQMLGQARTAGLM